MPMAPCFIAITLAGMLASGKPAKDARAYLFIGPSTRISSVVSAPGERPHARSELTIGPITTFAWETPEEVVRAPCVERAPKMSD
ncbi:Secreted protein [Methylorubrum aminovorans]